MNLTREQARRLLATLNQARVSSEIVRAAAEDSLEWIHPATLEALERGDALEACLVRMLAARAGPDPFSKS
jgi:hypothetical protein